MGLMEAKYESGDFQLGCALLPLHTLTLSYVYARLLSSSSDPEYSLIVPEAKLQLKT
jgi:hypothetical protein